MKTLLEVEHINDHDKDATPVFMVRAFFSDKDKEDSFTQSSDIQLGIQLQSPRKKTIKLEKIGVTSLYDGLRWYLEELGNCKSPDEYKEDADRVYTALREWGKNSHKKLFLTDSIAKSYYKAQDNGFQNLRIKISSNDPKVLSWPWEAIEDKKLGALSCHCHIDRHLKGTLTPPDVEFSKQKINVLFVISRPQEGDKEDIGFQTIIRPLLKKIQSESLPINIELLRPATYSKLQERLENKPNYYHIIHFDGHGYYSNKEKQGALLFEEISDIGEMKAKEVKAEMLIPTLANHRIPLFILNACQSATTDSSAEDAFASIAASLIKAKVYNVVAMSYKLHVNAAELFIPCFYNELTKKGSISEALRLAREDMYSNNIRANINGLEEYELNDWLIPVLYRQRKNNVYIFSDIKSKSINNQSSLPCEANYVDKIGVIGREEVIHKLERLDIRKGNILLHGINGIGKTVLLGAFLRWLENTNGLFQKTYWLDFNQYSNAEEIVRYLLKQLSVTYKKKISTIEKNKLLIEKLKETPILMAWDNFNSDLGEDIKLILNELNKCENKGSKILIAAHSDKVEINDYNQYREIEVTGFSNKECWDYYHNLLRKNVINKFEGEDSEKKLDLLFKDLSGHPQAILSTLLASEKTSIDDIRHNLREYKKASVIEVTLTEIAIDLFKENIPKSNIKCPIPSKKKLYDNNPDVKKIIGEKLPIISTPPELISKKTWLESIKRVGVGVIIGIASLFLFPKIRDSFTKKNTWKLIYRLNNQEINLFEIDGELLKKNNGFIVGSNPSVCNFTIPNHYYISEQHIRFTCEANQLMVEDLHSQWSTYKNKIKMTGGVPIRMMPNDQLMLGVNSIDGVYDALITLK